MNACAQLSDHQFQFVFFNFLLSSVQSANEKHLFLSIVFYFFTQSSFKATGIYFVHDMGAVTPNAVMHNVFIYIYSQR